jgi:putative ABC transport system permease protein
VSGEGKGPERRAFHVSDSRRVRQEVDEELRFHLLERVEELVAGGMSRVEAESEVRRRFGDLDRIGAQVADIDRVTYRRRSLGERAHEWAQALRYAARGMIARPGYSIVVIATLALAIGANTAIFSAVDAVLVRPLPVPALDRLLAIQWDAPEMSALPTPMSAGEVTDLVERSDLFTAVTGFIASGATLTGAGEAQRIAVARSTGDFAAVFGVRPLVGGFYGADASIPGNELVAVLGYGLWTTAFGADPAVVGRTITLDDRSYAVVGVMPADFSYPGDTQVWRPFALTERALSPEQRRSLNMMVVARLRPETTTGLLEQQLGSEVMDWEERFGGYSGGLSRFSLVPFRDHLSGQLRPVLLVLLGAVSFVLLIACANVASLQLVRAAGRAREVAVRVALGAGRRAVVRQHLLESLLYALGGGLGGVALGWLALRALTRWDVAQLRALSEVGLNGPVLAFSAAVTLAAGLIFGVVPAWRTSRVSASEALKESGARGTGGPQRHRLLQVAVVAQLALTLVLLLGSGVMVRSLGRLLEVEPGFRSDGVTTMQLSPPNSRYGLYAARVELFDRVLERLRALPGVESVALSGTLPFSDMILDSSPFAFVGDVPMGGDSILHATAIAASAELFETLGVRMVRGRSFRPGEGRRVMPSGVLQEPVAVIDEEFARQYFPGVDPVGRQIDHYGYRGVTIVGVVESVSQSALDAAYKANVYYPYSMLQFPLGAAIVVRSSLAPAAVTSMVAAAVREVDPQLPIYDARTMDERIARSLGDRSLAATVLGAFAVLALALALLGTYGVLSYSTAQRTRELGIRLAVGARPVDVIGMVVRTGGKLAALGLGTGMLVYLTLSRLLESIVYGVGPRDGLVMTTGLAVLLAAALFASWLPARRAARVDPVEALRRD